MIKKRKRTKKTKEGNLKKRETADTYKKDKTEKKARQKKYDEQYLVC